MRILLTCHFPLTGSGSGVYTLNVAHALAKCGHEVRIVMPENRQPEHYENFGVHPVYFDGCTAEALPFNFPCFTTHPRSVQTFYDLSDEELSAYEGAFRAALEEEIETFAPDVIHCGHAWLIPHYAIDYKIPVVITVHGTDLIGYERSDRFHDEVAHAMQECASVITISQENDQLVRRLFPDQVEKCSLILNGYNSDVFYPEVAQDASTDVSSALAALRREVLDQFGIEGDFAYIVSFAGKFAHFKGIDILLRGAQKYQRDDTITILAGDGELFDEMTSLADELGLRNVAFVHNQPHAALRKLYSAADVSLLTSRKEPFGLVIIEAMACGAPVIGSDDGGAVDIVTPEVGMLFQSENPDDLAEKVTAVLDGKATFDRARVAAYAKERFSQDESIGHLIDRYERAIAG